MRTLMLAESQVVCGGELSDKLETLGGAAGAIYGAGCGAAITFPFAAAGTLFCVTQEPILWYGVVGCSGFFVAGIVGGAIVGHFFGSTVVAVVHSVVSYLSGS